MARFLLLPNAGGLFMTFKRFLGIGIATIIYGVCAVGWADVKPINPQTDCLAYVGQNVFPSTALGNYKAYAQIVNGQYVLCFNQPLAQSLAGTAKIQPALGDILVIYGLKLAKTNTVAEPAISVSGNSVLLQNIQLTGPGSAVAGSVGIAFSGSGHAIINSTITGFEMAIQANCSVTQADAQSAPVGCTIGPKNVTDNVKQGVVVPTTGQGVTITQNEIRTIYDPYGTGQPVVGTTQKIVLQGAANGGLTPPTFSIDPVTMTIWKTLTEDGLFVTEIGGVLPKNGTLDLFEHHRENYKFPDGSYKYMDYFRASCPTAQNDKGQWEFKCTGLNIDAEVGQVFTDVTYVPNTSAMTQLINVKDIPEYKKTAAVNPGQIISGGGLTDAGSGQGTPPAGDGGLVVGGAGETVAMNNPGPSDMGGSSAPPLPEGDGTSDGGSASAMTGGAMVLAGDAPSTGGASSGCGAQMIPGVPAQPGVILWWLVPIVTLCYKRKRK